MIGRLFAVVTFAAILLNGFSFQVYGINMNTERALLLGLVPYLAFLAVVSRRLRIDSATGFYLGWLVVLGLSAMLTPSPLAHINGFLISASPFFFYLLFRSGVIDDQRGGVIFEILLWIMSISGIVIFFLYITTGNFAFLIDRGRLKLTMMEPNLFGATIATIMLAHYGFFRRCARHYILHACSLVALVLSFSKGPYLAFAVGFVYFALRANIFRTPVSRTIVFTLPVVIVLSSFFFTNFITEAYSSFLDRPDAINNRMYALYIGWDRFIERPILGNGPLDFSIYNSLNNPGVLDSMGTENERNLWIWQMVVSLLHDSGIVGSILFAGFVALVWKRAELQIKCGKRVYIGYLASLLALLISCQATTSHLAAIFGVITGLSASRPIHRRETCLLEPDVSARGRTWSV